MLGEGQGIYLCYSQIKIWREENMTNDKKDQFLKKWGIMTQGWNSDAVLQGSEISRDSSLLSDPNTQTTLKQPLQTQPSRGPCRAEGEGGLFSYKRRGLSGESSSYSPLPHDFCHEKNTCKCMTYNSASGRQAPHGGPADMWTQLKASVILGRAACVLPGP